MKTTLIVIVLIVAGLAVYKVLTPSSAPVVQQPASTQTAAAPASGSPATPSAKQEAVAGEFVAPSSTVTPLDPAATYTAKDNTVTIEISEYAGYAGLIAANNGLAPSEDSYFYQKHGFKVNLVVSEEESWSPLNSGRIGGATSTVDVLAIYGKQLQAVVPVQLSYSRGADAIVVKNNINRINDLKGKVVITAQFTETDFLIRYLAQEAGLKILGISALSERQPDAVNLLFTSDGFGAGDAFLENLDNDAVAACVTWEPKVSEVVNKSNSQAKVLISNRNLLVVGDVLMLNKGFAKQNPKIVAGLVDGILYGNNLLTAQPSKIYAGLKAAFKWSEADAKEELSKVHLTNFPENIQFFKGDIDASNTFGGIYQAAVYAYPSSMRHNVPWEQLITTTALDEVAASYKTQVANIQPIRAEGAKSSIENNPTLSKDIKFKFQPNSHELLDDPENEKFCTNVANLLRISPGSTVLLRGHVDNARVEEFRQQGGEALVRSMALRAMQLSRQRAESVYKCLTVSHNVPKDRIDLVSRGWEEPTAGTPDDNRRVEIYWFTVE